MEVIDRTKLFEEHAGEWVALGENDKVICSGSTLDYVLTEAKKQGYNSPVTAKIPPSKLELVF